MSELMQRDLSAVIQQHAAIGRTITNETIQLVVYQLFRALKVCLYICMCICMYVLTYVCMYVLMYVCMYVLCTYVPYIWKYWCCMTNINLAVLSVTAKLPNSNHHQYFRIYGMYIHNIRMYVCMYVCR